MGNISITSLTNSGTATLGNGTYAGTTVTNSGSLTLGATTLVLSGTGTVWNNTGTISASTSTIKFPDASSSAKTFAGGSQTYYNLQLTGAGSGTFIISGNNTFNQFTCDTPPHTINFTAGSRQTVTAVTLPFNVIGTAGNLMTLQSTVAGTQWQLASHNQVSIDYVSLQDSEAISI